MTEDESKIKKEAEVYANANKKQIAKELTDTSKYVPEDSPVSVFMAGSPGAGKTESSKNLIATFSKDHGNIIRIDSDEFRTGLPGYTGKNSSLFQGATTILAERVHDFVLKNKQSFVFDGTLSNFDKAKLNIERSLRKRRLVQILYVYQDPVMAWEFVKAREVKDGRHVPKEAFIAEYISARSNVNQLKKDFGNRIKVDLIVKNIDGTDFNYRENIDVIDNHISEKYTKDDLEKLLS